MVNDVGAAMAQSHLLGRGHRPYLVSRGHRPYLVSTGGTCRTLYKQGAQAVPCEHRRHRLNLESKGQRPYPASSGTDRTGTS